MAYSDRELLARLIECEAGGEGENGMKAVASVVMNRVTASGGEYARVGQGSIRNIIFQPGQFVCASETERGSYNPQNIYNMLLEELTAANLSMTPYDDINRIYLGYMLEKNALGNAVVIFDAHSDGFTIGVGYGKPIDEALVPQVISLFNDINCAVYVGKMVVSQSSDGWHPSYEIFVSANPDDISTWARENVLAYMYLALGTMEEMVDYITELANGETPENVFAMWYADSSAE